ncbi:MAG: hypothetical protein FJ271_24640 [Planctomycetes bacterium]|nr:hypothetical protein [Planctomycetota bacterium]
MSGILEPQRDKATTMRHTRSVALMSTPYLPPPTPKDIGPALPSAPSRRVAAPLVAVVSGLALLACGCIWATWFGFDSEPAAATELVSLPPVPETMPSAPQFPKIELVNTPVPPKAVKKAPTAAPDVPLKPAAQPRAVPQPPPLEVVALRPAKPAAPVKSTRTLTDAEQKKVDAAIEKGVRYLKNVQQKNGTWMNWGKHVVGYAALGGLTLLECDAPAGDPAVKKAAAFVRAYSANLNQTYDMSLAILFLDRLGDPKDRALIQQLAVRLIAGQTGNGGWSYECPILSNPEKKELLTFLRITRPEAAKLLNPLPAASKTTMPNALRKDGLTTALPLAKQAVPTLPKLVRGKENGKENLVGNDASVALIKPIGLEPDATTKKVAATPKEAPGNNNIASPAVKPQKAQAKPRPPALRIDQFSQRIRNVRVLLDYFYKGKAPQASAGDDNSNSQFAMLALWAARRHDVPTERVLALCFRRYQQTQNDAGGWNYHIGGRQTMGAMTGVGLLGLAMGHATSDEGLRFTAEALKRNAAARPAMQDPAILKGLQAFGQYIGEAQPGNFNPPVPNLYLLWTVERVAMLYNLKTIASKDWYRWGVYALLPHQNREGSWYCGSYPGSDLTVDTCFALLFLKRSNLVQDLTENLTFYLAITDSDARRSSNR